MAQRSRRTSTVEALPQAAQIVAFTETEEAFFREGEEMELAELQGPESGDELDPPEVDENPRA